MEKIRRRIMLRRTIREVVRETEEKRVTFICRHCGREQEAVFAKDQPVEIEETCVREADSKK